MPGAMPFTSASWPPGLPTFESTGPRGGGYELAKGLGPYAGSDSGSGGIGPGPLIGDCLGIEPGPLIGLCCTGDGPVE